MVANLAAHPDHLRELDPLPSFWDGANDYSCTGMDGVYLELTVQCFMWRSPFSAKMPR